MSSIPIRARVYKDRLGYWVTVTPSGTKRYAFSWKWAMVRAHESIRKETRRQQLLRRS